MHPSSPSRYQSSTLLPPHNLLTTFIIHHQCDEARPRCRACSRLELECSWAPAPNASPSPSTPSSFQASNYAASTQLAIPDLMLLHFWTTETSATITVPAHGDIWRTKMVEVGFRHPFVLHGILAVAAIHRGECKPPSSRFFAKPYSGYFLTLC